YGFIPKNEIWLDAENNSRNWPFVLYHEAWESRLMVQGVHYNEAHKRANAVERVLRTRYEPVNPGPVNRRTGPSNRLARYAKGYVARHLATNGNGHALTLAKNSALTEETFYQSCREKILDVVKDIVPNGSRADPSLLVLNGLVRRGNQLRTERGARRWRAITS